jgi:hypothetical protein
MKVQLLTAAILSLGMVVGTASLALSAGASGNGSAPGESKAGQDASGRNDNTYSTGPTLSTASSSQPQPIFHGMAPGSSMKQKPCGGDYAKITQANGTCRHIGAQ